MCERWAASKERKDGVAKCQALRVNQRLERGARPLPFQKRESALTDGHPIARTGIDGVDRACGTIHVEGLAERLALFTEVVGLSIDAPSPAQITWMRSTGIPRVLEDDAHESELGRRSLARGSFSLHETTPLAEPLTRQLDGRFGIDAASAASGSVR